jgi:hypothetical protein
MFATVTTDTMLWAQAEGWDVPVFTGDVVEVVARAGGACESLVRTDGGILCRVPVSAIYALEDM